MFDIAFDYMEGQGELLLYLEEFVPEEGQEALYDLVDILDSPEEYNETRPICRTCKVNLF